MLITAVHSQHSSPVGKHHLKRAKSKNRQNTNTALVSKGSGLILNSKTPWHRIQQSHLLADRKTGHFFAVDTAHLERLGPAPGVWIPLEKQHPDEPAVEYLSPLKRFKLKAQPIGPVAAKEPVDLTISLDENDENGRFQVIF